VRYATLDIGTNTALLLIAQWEGKTLKVIHDEVRIIRLGEGLHDHKAFIPKAQERALSVLKDYRKICDSFGVKKIAAVGTASFRKAQNAAQFIQHVKNESGITIEIISGDEEARLSYLSVEMDFGKSHKNICALDIGGGSTEIISKEGGISLDVGAVILTESIVRHDPITGEEYRMMGNKIDEAFAGTRLIAPGHEATLVGLAGSVTTLSAIKQKLSSWDGAKVQGSILTLGDIESMLSLFQNSTVAEKTKITGMVKGREDTILAGTLILKKVMKRLKVDQVIVSDRGLRYGLLHDVLTRRLGPLE